jgi:uncharacterized protein YacL (UPF0231 family)
MFSCNYDGNGVLRATSDAKNALLATFFEQDVQGSLGVCGELQSVIEEIESGIRESWISTGNAHTISINREHVVIHNEWSDEFGDTRIILQDFKACLDEWARCISSRPGVTP